MKLIIAGSRTITRMESLLDAMQASGLQSRVTEVVCGCARGVDTLGETWANKNKIPVKRFPADWNTHGKKAGFLRNRQMAEYGDALLLVWDGKSPGSRNMMQEAHRKELRVFSYIVTITGE